MENVFLPNAISFDLYTFVCWKFWIFHTLQIKRLISRYDHNNSILKVLPDISFLLPGAVPVAGAVPLLVPHQRSPRLIPQHPTPPQIPSIGHIPLIQIPNTPDDIPTLWLVNRAKAQGAKRSKQKKLIKTKRKKVRIGELVRQIKNIALMQYWSPPPHTFFFFLYTQLD